MQIAKSETQNSIVLLEYCLTQLAYARKCACYTINSCFCLCPLCPCLESTRWVIIWFLNISAKNSSVMHMGDDICEKGHVTMRLKRNMTHEAKLITCVMCGAGAGFAVGQQSAWRAKNTTASEERVSGELCSKGCFAVDLHCVKSRLA